MSVSVGWVAVEEPYGPPGSQAERALGFSPFRIWLCWLMQAFPTCAPSDNWSPVRLSG